MTTPPARATCATSGCAGPIVRERLGDGSTRWVHELTGAELCWPGQLDVAEPAIAPRHQAKPTTPAPQLRKARGGRRRYGR